MASRKMKMATKTLKKITHRQDIFGILQLVLKLVNVFLVGGDVLRMRQYSRF